MIHAYIDKQLQGDFYDQEEALLDSVLSMSRPINVAISTAASASRPRSRPASLPLKSLGCVEAFKLLMGARPR